SSVTSSPFGSTTVADAVPITQLMDDPGAGVVMSMAGATVGSFGLTCTVTVLTASPKTGSSMWLTVAVMTRDPGVPYLTETRQSPCVGPASLLNGASTSEGSLDVHATWAHCGNTVRTWPG